MFGKCDVIGLKSGHVVSHVSFQLFTRKTLSFPRDVLYWCEDLTPLCSWGYRPGFVTAKSACVPPPNVANPPFVSRRYMNRRPHLLRLIWNTCIEVEVRSMQLT